MKPTVVKQEAATQLDTEIDEDIVRPDTAPNQRQRPYALHIRMPGPPSIQGTQMHTRKHSIAVTSRELPPQKKTAPKPVSFAWKPVTPGVLQRSQSFKLPLGQTCKPRTTPATTKQLTVTKSFDRFTLNRQTHHTKTVSATDLGNALQEERDFRSFADTLPSHTTISHTTVSSREIVHLRPVTLRLRVKGISCTAVPSLLTSEPTSPLSVPQHKKLATVKLVWAADQQGVVLQSSSRPGCFRGSKVMFSRGGKFFRRPCARLSPNHFLAL